MLANDKLKNNIYESYNDCLSLTEVSEVLSLVTSKEIIYTQISMDE